MIDKDHLLKALRAAPRGLRADEISSLLKADAKGKHRLRRLLSDLIDEGAVEKLPGSRYGLPGQREAAAAEGAKPENRPARPGLVAGRLRVHPAGYGFVVRDDGEDDVFVPAKYRSNALDGDRVALHTWDGYKGTEGRVEEVLERGRAKVTGTLRKSSHGAWLEPDDPRIAATGGHVKLETVETSVKDGQAVVAEITRYPRQADEALHARVIHVLGDPDDPRTEVEKILICGDIPIEHPDDVLAAARTAPQVVRPEDLVDRIDLRDRHFLTIDPETARDFDDAVCIGPSPRAGCVRLWVAVADVSHYVRPGSALDREARIRGCSVYLPDRAIPMLPKELSAGICSLNPEVDRLAMVVRMEIDQNGGVIDPYFCAAVIRSKARLDYAGVAAALAGDLRGPRARYREFLPILQQMKEVAGRIRRRRLERGALDFDLPEAKVLLDEDDPTRVRDVVQSRADPEVKGAYQLVEDFMLVANEAVASHLKARGIDTLYRVHDIPAEERVAVFAEVAHAYGFKFAVEDGRDPRRLRRFLESIADKPPAVRRALNFLLLRTLKQAVYDVVNVGHFGLAAPDYLHFTSPIRRYPDLIVHRQLKHLLHQDGLAAGGPPPQVSTRKDLAQMAADSSSNERRAMEVEREVIDLYRAFLMRDRVGEVLDGTIAGVAPFGLFVQIEVPFVEGLVRTETLADGKRGEHWELDETGTRLSGRNTGRTFTLGDTVKVRVENVSVQRRKVDLVLEDHVPLYRGSHARYDSKDEARRRRSGRGDGGGPPRKGRARGR